jgi:hypothetical protein
LTPAESRPTFELPIGLSHVGQKLAFGAVNGQPSHRGFAHVRVRVGLGEVAYEGGELAVIERGGLAPGK